MLKSLFLTLVFCVTTTQSYAQPYATADRTKDAFILAKQYFESPNMSFKLKLWEDSHRFMYELLTQLDERNNVFKYIGMFTNTNYRGSTTPSIRAFKSFGVDKNFHDDDDGYQKYQEMVKAGNDLINGFFSQCEKTVTTKMKIGPKSSSKLVTEEYALERECAKGHFAGTLFDYDVKSIIIVKSEDKYSYEYKLLFDSAWGHNDNQYILNRIKGKIELSYFSDYLELDSMEDFYAEYEENLNQGYGDYALPNRWGAVLAKQMNKSKSKFESPIELRLIKTWGDCASGCYAAREYKVIATPTISRKGIHFDFETVEVKGDELPDPEVVELYNFN